MAASLINSLETYFIYPSELIVYIIFSYFIFKMSTGKMQAWFIGFAILCSLFKTFDLIDRYGLYRFYESDYHRMYFFWGICGLVDGILSIMIVKKFINSIRLK
jgi:hypothetical protein